MSNNIFRDEETNKRVLITGFGPFLQQKQNPSWEGVNSINKDELERRCNIHLFKEEVKVEYDYVDHSVPKLWVKYQPDLTIHVGVDEPDQSSFLLETKAHKCKYVLVDAVGRCPAKYQNSSAGPETIVTELDVDAIRQEFNDESPLHGLRAETSTDAGRYLCEYIYYTSLCRDRSKTLFVHVPPKCSTIQIAKGLERIIEISLRKLRKDKMLTIHVGVSGTSCFLLETQACKYGYVTIDEKNTCPVENKHWAEGPDSIVTDLDVDVICKKFNCNPPDGLRADKSSNAGRFVCEYIYYTSLYCRGASKTLFIHIPLDKYPIEKITQGLERILEICLEQLRNN